MSAENPYVNKVQTADGTVIMDISSDTATPSDVLNGVTFHDRSGTPQQGSLITHNVYDGLDSTSTTDALSAKQGKILNDALSEMVKNVAINRDTSATSHYINVPSSSWHIITIVSNGTAAFWMGYVFSSSVGNVSTLEIKKGSDITITPSTNKLTWTTGVSRIYKIVDEVIFGDACS